VKRFTSVVGSVAIAVAAIFATAPQAVAQVTATGTIEIVVQDPAGLPLPGVTVSAQAADAVTRREAVTDDQGRAVLVGLAPSSQYVVNAQLTGFAPARNENVLVRSGQTATVQIGLKVGGVSEQVQVTADTPTVDVSTATTGQDITLQLTESLPTGRSYQSYLQLVPGVLPDDPQTAGNPASKSGLNYSDIAGALGVSSDNFYYFNGINVTDPVSGTFGSNLNTEIIQEQRVLTGGIPAEFVGTPGLLSSVITKTGTNRFNGSVNYFFQNDNLFAKNKNSPDEKFGTFDAAGTIGGPIVQNKAWFFGSYRRVEREDDVTLLDTQVLQRTVKNEQDQGYAKATWTPTSADTLSFTFLNDPTNASGRRDRTLTNARDRSRVQGGDNYSGNYSRLMGGLLVDAAVNVHNGEVSDFSAIQAQSNTVIYRGTDTRVLTDEQRGGWGQSAIDQRDTKGFRATATYNLGAHTAKAGFEWSRNNNFRNTTYIDDALMWSFAPHLSGFTGTQLAAPGLSTRRFNPNSVSDFGGLITTINGLPNRAAFYSQYDVDGNGTITSAELGSRLTFTTPGPDGTILYARNFETQEGPQDLHSDGASFFVQDQFSFNRFTANVGVRAEQWKHFATTGANIFTFDWEFAPRLSLTYDLAGNGRQKLGAFWGRYYDPIRNNMTQFAGTLTGQVIEEQLFINNQWVTYRTRGGAVQQDAFFSPTTQTPYTDDTTIQYQVDLGRHMSFETAYTNRRTRDILEDYDLSLYALDTAGTPSHYPGDINAPGSLWLGLDYFGYDVNPGSNFVIATLAGGKRDYNGLDLIFRKRYSDNWQALVSYSYNRARGNTNSDSQADFQGDYLWLDPRSPNAYATQPGTIPHVFKAAGSYHMPFGVLLGANYRWNSGARLSRTYSDFGRNLPLPSETPYEFNGATDTWIQPGVIGTLENPSWGQLDLRAEYKRSFGGLGTEFFVDIFNVTNNQDAIRIQDLVAGSGGTDFMEATRFLDPRRFFLGARLSF
jgi:hypothetical protein